MSTIDSRREQMFPTLAPQEIDRIRRFGRIRRYAAGEALFTTGEIAPGMYVLIKGAVRVVRRDPLGHSAPIVEHGPGEFVAEVGQLSGQPAFVDVHAISEVEALLIPPENLRALMIEEPELGERIMHALILRRVALIEAGTGGPVLIGPEASPDVVRLQGFLARNAYPHQLLDPAKDDDAAKLVQQYAPDPADLPLAVCPKGTVLKLFPPPPTSLPMRCCRTQAVRTSALFFCRPRPGFCASSRSRECLRVSMPFTFMPWASEPPRSTRRARASIRATRTTVSWQGQDMPATCRTRILRQTARSKSDWSIRRS